MRICSLPLKMWSASHLSTYTFNEYKECSEEIICESPTIHIYLEV